MKRGDAFGWNINTADFLLRFLKHECDFNFTETKEIIEQKLKE